MKALKLMQNSFSSDQKSFLVGRTEELSGSVERATGALVPVIRFVV